MPIAFHETLVLGIGNLLWADEGFGVRCVEHMAEHYDLPERVQLLDGGTQGLYLLPYVQQACRLIVFDAIDYGLPPGTMRLIENAEVPRFMGAKKMSLHQTGFQEVIAAAELTGQCPAEMLLIGIQPVELDDYGGSLRAPIAARRLRRWGMDVRRRATPVAKPAPSPLSISSYESDRPSADAACRFGDARVLAVPAERG